MLGIVDLQSSFEDRCDKNFIVIEFPVDQRTAPYLVSSASGFRWVPNAPQGVVRVTVRSFPREDPSDFTQIFREAVDEVLQKNKENTWGLKFPLTSKGLSDAQDLILWHGFESLDLLCHPDFDWEGFVTKEWPEMDQEDPTFRMFAKWRAALEEGTEPDGELFGMRLKTASWLPDDLLMLIPVDREFVGSIGLLFGNDIIVNIHNAIRSLAFVGE